jgi:hypothetical protein
VTGQCVPIPKETLRELLDLAETKATRVTDQTDDGATGPIGLREPWHCGVCGCESFADQLDALKKTPCGHDRARWIKGRTRLR